MSKITNKQTRAVPAVVLTGAQLAIRANAETIAALDYSTASGAAVLEFSVLFSGHDIEEFKACRAEWLAGYATATGCEATSAVTRFSEMVRAANVVKPQTEKAAKMQAARAVAKSAIDKASEADTEKTGAAKSAGALVKMELSSIEAHIVGMLRAGKFTLAAQAIAQLAEQTALV